jgi:hypothetical protein
MQGRCYHSYNRGLSMPLSSDGKTHFEFVLQHLETERSQVQQDLASLQARMKELQISITALSRSINPDSPPRPLSPIRPVSQKYANLSVRWAILDLLNGSKAMNTSEIAEALKADGVQTKAANFANNVSAILSTTMKGHKEVEQLPDGRWQLTETGVSAIEHIRTTSKFRRACGY